MHRTTASIAAFVLLIAVVLGAFGAHGLKSLVEESSLNTWRTGVDYQFYHGFALLFLSLASDHLTKKIFTWIRTLWITGIVLFSGSLYLLVLAEPFEFQSIASVLGPITPIGGLLFIIGWSVLLITTVGSSKS